ncbi:MAG: Asp-tRNA(Asn)/Glu-tRNA(Gln) amidotransferase subunit GatA [Chloroflexi bacterium]|nr:Asp-tRNA(Asn)/Glu-tRNA(Gln) amidotransferase subunit GatA [Chloroflexota bacterium]MCH8066259.1 Asp-tRNA(Asn)/Glu-tRNA(Gln) amidotransferase subunit GatA [Chloroflexota bacterium]
MSAPASSTELHRLTAHEAQELLSNREVSARELTQASLDRIAAVDEQIGAYLTVVEEHALAQADAADERIGRGDGGPLTGIPVAVKDNMCTVGIRTTCGSRMLEQFVPPYNAHVIERLNDAGAVLLGKTNMDEFAMGSSVEHSAFHPTHNPWSLDRVPGGSSGGSAAAVAADEAIVALGSDTGGSVRQPAAHCGVVGFKPTYGRVSRYGLVAFASSLDQIGPLTKDVRDCALLMNAISGQDPRDATSAPIEVPDFTAALTGEVQGLRVGVVSEYVPGDLDPAMRGVAEAAVKQFEELGATVEWGVSLPSTEYALACYYIIAPSEASANLARYDGVKYGYSYTEGESMWENMDKTRQFGFGDEVKRRIMIGTYALSSGYYDAYYLKALQVRTLIRREFEEAFERFDVLLGLVAPTPAFRLGEKLDDPYQMYLSDIFTLPQPIAGIPSISVPAGFVEGPAGERLPVGLQLMGRPFDEAMLLRAADAYERATSWREQRPEW